METEGKIRYTNQKDLCEKSRLRDIVNVEGGNKYSKKCFYVSFSWIKSF